MVTNKTAEQSKDKKNANCNLKQYKHLFFSCYFHFQKHYFSAFIYIFKQHKLEMSLLPWLTCFFSEKTTEKYTRQIKSASPAQSDFSTLAQKTLTYLSVLDQKQISEAKYPIILLLPTALQITSQNTLRAGILRILLDKVKPEDVHQDQT